MLHFHLIFSDFCKKIILFSLYWITSFLFQSRFAEDFRCIILDRIKRVLFGGNFYLGLLKTLFYYKKFFVSYFGGKNLIEPITIKIHTHNILLMQLNLLLEIKSSKNGEWKSYINIHFSKQMLLFHHFLPFILRYVKKMCSIIRILLLYYVFNFYQELLSIFTIMFQFTDRFSSLNH